MKSFVQQLRVRQSVSRALEITVYRPYQPIQTIHLDDSFNEPEGDRFEVESVIDRRLKDGHKECLGIGWVIQTQNGLMSQICMASAPHRCCY